MPTSSFKHQRYLALTLAGGSVLSALLVAELFARLAGFQPWRYQPDLARPEITEPDETLGWRNRAGHYQLPAYVSGGPATVVNFLPDGRRRSTPGEERPGRPRVVFLGCSFTQGWGISDDETFCWKLQELHQELQIENHGVAGYGTYTNYVN